MSAIKKKLQDWEKHGLLTDAQLQKIITYEHLDKPSSKIMYTFIILGVSVVGLGIIAIIAANWSLIPASVKLVNNFVL